MNYFFYYNKLGLKLFNDKKFIIDNNVKYFLKNKKYYYNYSYTNNLLFNNLINMFSLFCENKHNLLFIDNNEKLLTPLYNYIYGFKNIYVNKDFFFLKKSFLTFNNWLYLYLNFLNKNNINLLIFLDYLNFSKFFNIFNKLNIPIISIVPNNIKPVYIDYYISLNFNYLNIYKIVFYNYYINIFFKYYNLNIKTKKIFFFNKYNYINSVNHNNK